MYQVKTHRIVLPVLLLSMLPFLLYLLIRVFTPLHIDYNEGWNSGFSSLLAKGEPLFYPLHSTLLNNYPPLSFYLVKDLSTLVGDHIIAGRILALSGLLLTLFCQMILLRGKKIISVVVPLLFLFYHLFWHFDYVGMNDPQWFAQGVMMVGLTLFLTAKFKGSQLITIMLFTTAGLIKHSLIPIPVAVTLWLFIQKDPRFKSWMTMALIALVGVFLYLRLSHSSFLWDSIFHAPRLIKLSLIPRVGVWLTPFIIPISLILQKRVCPEVDSKEKLVIIYLIISLIWGVFSSAGAGVYFNLFFDFEIALFLLIGIRLSQSSTKEVHRNILILFLPILFVYPMKLYETKTEFLSISTKKQLMQEDVTFCKSYSNVIVCENLSLLYWSEKPYLFDIFTMCQKVSSGFISAEEFMIKLEEISPELLQLDAIDSSNYRVQPEVMKLILERYQVVRESSQGYFLEPMK